MRDRAIILAVVALIILVYGTLSYVANGFATLEMNLLALAISTSIAYLFYEALTCRRVRGNIVGINLRRRLDFKEASRIFGPIALLPAATIILSNSPLGNTIKPLRLYVLFVLLFLVGWALGTVETSKHIEAEDSEEIA